MWQRRVNIFVFGAKPIVLLNEKCSTHNCIFGSHRFARRDLIENKFRCQFLSIYHFFCRKFYYQANHFISLCAPPSLRTLHDANVIIIELTLCVRVSYSSLMLFVRWLLFSFSLNSFAIRAQPQHRTAAVTNACMTKSYFVVLMLYVYTIFLVILYVSNACKCLFRRRWILNIEPVTGDDDGGGGGSVKNV